MSAEQELVEIKKLLKEADVPCTGKSPCIQNIKWLIAHVKASNEIIDKYEEMTGIMLIHNKVGKILEVPMEELT